LVISTLKSQPENQVECVVETARWSFLGCPGRYFPAVLYFTADAYFFLGRP